MRRHTVNQICQRTFGILDFKDENKHFTSEKFDACSDKDLVNLIVALIGDLEDEDENFLDKLNMEERTVYGISQLKQLDLSLKHLLIQYMRMN